jgi:hypothetical protein
MAAFLQLHIGVRFSKLHLEHPDEDVDFFGPVKALP